MRIGEKIRMHRTELGMTQEQVAQRLNTTPQTIYKYEKGLVENIPLSVIVDLANIFNIEPIDLTDWYDTPTPDPFLTDMQQQESPHPFYAFTLSEIEKEIIKQYRAKPNFQQAILNILEIKLSDFSSEQTQFPAKVRAASTPPTAYTDKRKNKNN